MRLLVGVALLLGATAVEAATWKLLGTSADKRKVYVDVVGAVETGSVRSFWMKYVSPTGAEQKERISIECASNTFTVLDDIVTNDRGVVTKSSSVPDYAANWAAIPPETIVEGERNMICPQYAG